MKTINAIRQRYNTEYDVEMISKCDQIPFINYTLQNTQYFLIL